MSEFDDLVNRRLELVKQKQIIDLELSEIKKKFRIIQGVAPKD